MSGSAATDTDRPLAPATAPPASPMGSGARHRWPDYSAVWRWHFYAGLFCLPFFCWLALTGSVYLFRPDVEAWLDRPFEALRIDGPRALPSSEVGAALAAVPGSVFSHYEPPATPTGAAQVVVGRDGHLYRVYVHPASLQAMRVIRDDHRLMELVSHLHGNLLLDSTGSMVVELAGSWGVVMILTGIYLWLPRKAARLGGVLYPRIRLRGRAFWRDLHAATGFWVSTVTLFLLLSGLPWAVSWGNYLTWVRNHWAATAGTPDWPIGGQAQSTSHFASPAIRTDGMPGMSDTEMAATSSPDPAPAPAADVSGLDKVAPLVQRLHVPPPVWVTPPAAGSADWTISSHIQNRPLRITYAVDPHTGHVTGTDRFADQNIVDKVVNVVVATHEGQLFGRINQVILLVNALALITMVVSAVVMWWRRRPTHALGAPQPGANPRFSTALVIAVAVLALLLPLFGLSLLLVQATERVILKRIPRVERWLGLARRAT